MVFSPKCFDLRHGNAKLQPDPVIEHLVGRGAQVDVMQLNDWKGCNQDPPYPRPHLRVGSRGTGILHVPKVSLST